MASTAEPLPTVGAIEPGQGELNIVGLVIVLIFLGIILVVGVVASCVK